MEFRFTPSCDSGGSFPYVPVRHQTTNSNSSCKQISAHCRRDPRALLWPCVGSHTAPRGVSLITETKTQLETGNFTYYIKIKTGQAQLKQLQMVIKSCISKKNAEIKCLSLFTSDSKKRGSGSKFKGPFSKFVENSTSKYKIPLQSCELEYTLPG